MGRLVIGLTGQTGAGKSTAAAAMKKLGCASVNADILAREVVEAGSDCLKLLTNTFGCDIINPDGSLNRRALAKKAFSSKENTEQLNSITHPFIIALARQRIDEAFAEGYNIVVFDAPQLFESGGDKLCDVIVSVTAPKECRLSRIIARDNITREQALYRMGAQLDEEFFAEHSDYIFDGSGTPEQLSAQVMRLIELIRAENTGIDKER